MLKVMKAATGVLGLWITAGLAAVPADAGCNCYGGYGYRTYGYAPVLPPPPPRYVYQRGVAYYYDVRPRGYATTYPRFSPPAAYAYAPPPNGFVYVDRGPAVIINRPRVYRRW